jgi:hypothetical protein
MQLINERSYCRFLPVRRSRKDNQRKGQIGGAVRFYVASLCPGLYRPNAGSEDGIEVEESWMLILLNDRLEAMSFAGGVSDGFRPVGWQTRKK